MDNDTRSPRAIGRTVATAIGGTIRASPALAVVEVIRDLGCDPAPILAEAGWSLAMLADPDKFVPYAALGRLLAVAASHTGCDHIGLRAGQKAGPAAIGMVGFAARHAVDVRTCLCLLIRNLPHHDRGAVGILRTHGSVATFGYRIHHPTLPGSRHITSGALAIMFQLMKGICGPEWLPVETSFALRRPADVKAYQAQFGERIRFDAEDSALSFASHWLDAKVKGADPELHRVLSRMIDEKGPPSERSLCDEVRDLLAGMIGGGQATQGAVARAFNMSSSTLHRRLATLGTSFQDLLDEVRCQQACRLLAATAMSVAEIAAMLDYSEPSAFTRSFKRKMGCGPADWRAARMNANGNGEIR